MSNHKDQVTAWQTELAGAEASAILDWAATQFRGAIRFASSLGLEDQVLTDMIAKHHPEIGIFTLDTGRLFVESYDLLQATRDRYHLPIEVYFPDSSQVETMVRDHGVNLFYQSVEFRKMCCGVRKVQPLQRALKGLGAWLCGLRKEQSSGRQEVGTVEWDAANNLVKINPLVEWTLDELWAYIKEHQVPYNSLHDRGYPSIGCACCTRAVRDGEDIRAGRWWWEQPQQKECGLHMVNGKLVRKEITS